MIKPAQSIISSLRELNPQLPIDNVSREFEKVVELNGVKIDLTTPEGLNKLKTHGFDAEKCN